MSENAQAQAALLSRPITVDELRHDGQIIDVVATEAERQALAQFNGLAALRSLVARLIVRPEPGGGVSVKGALTADVAYICVVTLEPFDAELKEPVEAHLLPESALAAFRAAREKQLRDAPDEAEAADEPDAIVDGRIDLGVLASEYLTLGLDPYPKKPGAAFVEPAPKNADPDLSPFAALKTLKNNTD